MAAVDELWKAYKETGDETLRSQLVSHYQGLVERIANQMASKLPQTVETDDLIGYGYFGLLDAIEKFEPERGFKFETYAGSRINGSIVDELRKMDWVPRSVRGKIRLVNLASQKLAGQLGRHPTDEEVAAELDWPIVDVWTAMNSQASSNFVELDWTVGDDSETGLSLQDRVADRTSDQPFEFDHILFSVVDGIESLPEKEKIVMTLFYYEGLSLNDIGRVLGVTESRVCQILTKAVLHGRSQLTEVNPTA